MVNKVYESVKKLIKTNYKIFIFLFICFLIFTFKFPYYVSAPGGLINTEDRIDSSFKMKGSLNMAYVSQMDGTIPILLYSLVNSNWDVEREDKLTVGSETVDDQMYRNKLLLEEATKTSLLVAYNKSNIKYKTYNKKVFITYKDDFSKTDLKVGDQIIMASSKEITGKQDLYDYIGSKNVGDKVFFTVIRNGKKMKCSATLIDVAGEAKVGLLITETFDIKSDYPIRLKFKESESGSSGGLMMSLTAYSHLNRIDLTAGKKIVGTGTIDEEGRVGEISGIKYKLIGAVKKRADVFLVPRGNNYKEARDLKYENNYKIELVPVSTFDEALDSLENM